MLQLLQEHNSFNIRRSFTCTSENVVYCIICSKCGHLYIGETGRRLGDRFREHLGDIRNKRIERSDVAKHFNLVGHNTENVNIVGLLHCSNTFQRKQCETKLISKFGTLVPFGMNKD